MNKIKEILDSKYFLLILAFFVFIEFAIPYMSLCGTISTNAYNVLNDVKDGLYGILFIFLLVYFKDTYYSILALLFYPFTICEGITTDNIIFPLIMPVLGLLIGVILHMIIYKPKLKFGKYQIGILIMMVGLSFGGLFSVTVGDYRTYWFYWWIPIVMLILTALIIFYFSFAVSTTNAKFIDIVKAMNLLAIIVALEVVLFFAQMDSSIIDYLDSKTMTLGWGIHNNVAMIMLTCMPFSVYMLYIDFKRNWKYLLLYILEFLVIISTISKGGILVGLIGALFFVILLFVRTPFKKQFLLGCAIVVFVGMLAFLGFYFAANSYFDSFMSHVNFGTMWSRYRIYKSAINVIKSNFWFGIGIFGGLGWIYDATYYQCAHDTFLQMFISGGLVGFICFMYHIVDKYSRLLHKINIKKIIMLLSFLLPGIYGLIDVSYLNPTYTMALLIQLILFNNEIKEERIKYLF